jgi:hypothetical protein
MSILILSQKKHTSLLLLQSDRLIGIVCILFLCISWPKLAISKRRRTGQTNEGNEIRKHNKRRRKLKKKRPYPLHAQQRRESESKREASVEVVVEAVEEAVLSLWPLCTRTRRSLPHRISGEQTKRHANINNDSSQK